jgi:hypothetical protein
LPLRHVLRSHDDGVPYVASLDLVRRGHASRIG